MRPRSAQPIREALPLPLQPATVRACLNVAHPQDALFEQAWRSGTETFTRRERNTIAGVTGHVAESVAEVLLEKLGWHVLWHFTGPGRHGVDLLELTPDGKVVAIEVKGTLVPRRIPSLTRRDLTQMSVAWIDKSDNPGMAALGLESNDIYGGFTTINFADLTWRVALTTDFLHFHPTYDIDQLRDLGWLG